MLTFPEPSRSGNRLPRLDRNGALAGIPGHWTCTDGACITEGCARRHLPIGPGPDRVVSQSLRPRAVDSFLPTGTWATCRLRAGASPWVLPDLTGRLVGGWGDDDVRNPLPRVLWAAWGTESESGVVPPLPDTGVKGVVRVLVTRSLTSAGPFGEPSPVAVFAPVVVLVVVELGPRPGPPIDQNPP